MDLEQIKQEYSQLGISSDFMFKKIIGEEKYAKPFLETVLGFPIDHVEIIEKEKELQSHVDMHAIRLDVYVNDGHTIYDCEMQTSNKKNLPKRSRYYQSQIDATTLEHNTDYNLLKKTYIIFVCTFDPFEDDRYVYTFESYCKENKEIELTDESIKVFLNTKGHKGNVSDEFKELMHFFDTSEMKVYKSDFVNSIKDALQEARLREDWRGAYMTLLDYGDELKREAREEALAEAREEAREKGIVDQIETARELGATDEYIVGKISTLYDLSKEEAEQRLRDHTK